MIRIYRAMKAIRTFRFIEIKGELISVPKGMDFVLREHIKPEMIGIIQKERALRK